MISPSSPRGFREPKDRLTDRQCAAIGRVAAVWSEIEFAMERILSRLAMAPSLLGYVLTAKLGPDNRIVTIQTLLKVHKNKYRSSLVGHDVLADIGELLKPLRKLKDRRNFIIHSVWIKISDAYLSRFDIDASAPSIRVGYNEKLADIEKFADEIEELSNRLWDLGSRIPAIGAALLDRLNELDLRNRLAPPTQVMRQFQHQSSDRIRGAHHPSKKHRKG